MGRTGPAPRRTSTQSAPRLEPRSSSYSRNGGKSSVNEPPKKTREEARGKESSPIPSTSKGTNATESDSPPRTGPLGTSKSSSKSETKVTQSKDVTSSTSSSRGAGKKKPKPATREARKRTHPSHSPPAVKRKRAKKAVAKKGKKSTASKRPTSQEAESAKEKRKGRKRAATADGGQGPSAPKQARPSQTVARADEA